MFKEQIKMLKGYVISFIFFLLGLFSLIAVYYIYEFLCDKDVCSPLGYGLGFLWIMMILNLPYLYIKIKGDL